MTSNRFRRSSDGATAGRPFIAACVAALAAAALLSVTSGAIAATPSTVLSAGAGMRIDGHLWRQHAGSFVARAGDVNGDGLDDVLVGTQESHSADGPVWNAYVVFGRRGARGSVTHLDRLSGRGLRIVTTAFGFSSGAAAGDVNGDGLDDVVLGKGEREGSRGAAFVVFGRRSAGTINVARLGRSGITLTSGGNAESLGAAVAGAGDLDRDGFDDVLVGEPEYVPAGGEFGTGRAVVVYGARAGGRLDVRNLGRRGTEIIGPGPYRQPPSGRLFGVGFAQALAGAGDTNGDRRPDVLVGTPYLDGSGGGAFVVLTAGRRGSRIDVRASPAGTYRIAGQGREHAGFSVADGGDQNGDGLHDLLVGTLTGGGALFSANGPSGAYVVYGRRDPSDLRLGALGALGAVLHDAADGDRAGFAVANAGDVTGDGRADLLVGAPLADRGDTSAAGSALLVPGGRLRGTVDLRDMTSRGARRYDGAKRFDTAGWAVTGLGDVNGDRHRDFAVAAPRADFGGEQAGSVFVVYGQAG